MSAERSTDPSRLFGVAAEFDSPEAIVAAAHALTSAGYASVQAYTPMPVEELDEALHLHGRTRVAPIVLSGAIVGSATGYAMQWVANVYHYPQNIGGRPLNSWPMFIPITFELAILTAAASGVIAMFILNRLPRLSHPMSRVDGFTRASRDRFFLCVEASDPHFDAAAVRAALELTQALVVREVLR